MKSTHAAALALASLATVACSDDNKTVTTPDTGTGRSAVVLADTGITAPTTGNNAIRFFNATGASSDLYFTGDTAAVGTATFAALANNSANSTGYVSYAGTNTRIRLFPAGGATTGTRSVNYSLPTLTGTREATVLLRGVTGAPAFAATPCT